jgi:tetratricopeptide (TPR) repeat protein
VVKIGTLPWPPGRRAALTVVAVLTLALLVWTGFVVYRQLAAGRHRREAEQALEKGDLGRARAHLELCLEAWPNSGEIHYLTARTARRQGAYDDANRHLGVCRRLGWPDEAIRLERALLEAEQQEPTLVESYLLSCVHKDHPDAVLILEALTRGYLKSFQMLRALECLDLWLHRQPNAVQALLWRGEVRERLDRYEPALDDLRQAVRLEPEAEESRLRLARLLSRARLFKEALPHYEQLHERRPGDAEVLLGLASCQRRLSRQEDARQLLDMLLAAQPRHAQALSERGQLALEAGQLNEAEEWLRRAVAAAPYEREAVYALGQCLFRQEGKEAEAQQWLARLERIDADLKRMTVVMKDITRSPRDPELRTEAGVLLLRNGQEKEGLRWLESALRLDSRHPSTLQALSDYFERQGKK